MSDSARLAKSRASGGSWGIGAQGPAILWGPLQGCDLTFPSWGVWGCCKPHNGVGAEPLRQSILAAIENLLKIRYRGRLLHNSNPISDVVAYGKSGSPGRL